jgi:hypothetical protein
MAESRWEIHPTTLQLPTASEMGRFHSSFGDGLGGRCMTKDEFKAEIHDIAA